MRRRPTPGARLVRALRALTATLALLLVGAQLSSIGHHVLVAHYLCSEHGTLHHGDAPVARPGERASGPAALPSDSADHGNHDDCFFPARTPAELVDIARTAVVVTSLERSVDVAACASPAQHDSIPLLALAPKLSPPRA